MRYLITLLLIVLVFPAYSGAKVMVSPMIIEAEQVKKGDCFQIVCKQKGDLPVDIELSLALFDQDQTGSVFFLEDSQALKTVRQVLNLDRDYFCLEPLETQSIMVEVMQTDFDSCYAALFVKPIQSGIPTRLAVLFLLSSGGKRAEIDISSWEQDEQFLELTVANSGASHGLWRGELLLYDGQDNLNERRAVESGVVLAERHRTLQITLPDWVQRVEIGRLP